MDSINDEMFEFPNTVNECPNRENWPVYGILNIFLVSIIDAPGRERGIATNAKKASALFYFTRMNVCTSS